MHRRTAFWLLLPLTAIQGLWLKFRATRLSGAQGIRKGTVGHGESLHLLAIGDSIIDGVGARTMDESLPVQFARALSKATQRRVDWLVEGESGLDVSGLLQHLDTLEAEVADVILISIGVNDVTGLSSTKHWRRSVARLLDRLLRQWPDARIVFTGLPPMSQFPLPPQPLRSTLGWRAATLDSIASELCAHEPNVIHVPTTINPQFHTFCQDGFHPSTESYRIWAKELAIITTAA